MWGLSPGGGQITRLDAKEQNSESALDPAFKEPQLLGGSKTYF